MAGERTPRLQGLEHVQEVFSEGPGVVRAFPDVLRWKQGHRIYQQLSWTLQAVDTNPRAHTTNTLL